MKYLKLFENINGKNKIQNLLYEYNKMCNMLQDFIILENKVNKEDIRDVYMFYYESNLDEIGKESLVVSFVDKDREYGGTILNEKELEKLYKFIENPELYKQTKKYNL